MLHDSVIILPAVGNQAAGAILDSIIQVPEISAAPVTQSIQRTIAEQAAERIRIRNGMTGEIFTGPILRKFVIFHLLTPHSMAPFQGADE